MPENCTCVDNAKKLEQIIAWKVENISDMLQYIQVIIYSISNPKPFKHLKLFKHFEPFHPC